MAEWSFQRKLITGVILVCMLAILTSAAALFASRVLIANMADLATGEGVDLVDARNLQLAGLKAIADVHACLLTGGKAYGPEVAAASADVRKLAATLQGRLDPGPAKSLLDEVVGAESRQQSAFAQALAASHAPGGAPADLYSEAVIARGARLDEALASFVGYMQTARVRSLVGSRALIGQGERILNVVTIATILMLVILCAVLIEALNRSYRLQTTALNRAEVGQTEAKASLTEAEEASHLKDEFLATVSHELRNPLAPILTWTQLLRSGTLDTEKSKRALEVIERNVTSQAQLIDDLIDVSRVVSGKFRLDVRPLDLAPVIKSAADSQVPASDAKQIRLQLVLDERAGLISGDSERIQQVMWNLISNAIKFTPKGGRVQVVLQRAMSHVEITVSDSGIGIDREFLPHVFEPFRQATGGSMRRHGGLGLGLSIVRHIVEMHGGEIIAMSDGPNKGAKFTVKFPLLATAQEGAEPVSRHPIARDTLGDIRLGRLDGVRVLLVEDEPSASEALLALFESCGATAKVASSAAEALETFARWQPDVLVSDIAMPGEDGYSLIRKIRLRSLESGGLVPAVALTAYAKIEDRVTILAAGFQMYLAKPADPHELIAVVSSLAKHWRLGEPRPVG